MRNYEYHEIDSHIYETNLINKSNPILIDNFNKVARWIEENYPTLDGEFECRHNPYHWVKLVVENGKAFLECGSHGNGFDIAMSTTETAIFVRGSMQRKPCAFARCQFFRNDYLEEFLSQWKTIKALIIEAYSQKNMLYESFEV